MGRIYMTDAAARRLAARDAELNPEPMEAIEDIMQRIDNIEGALAVIIERGDTDGPAGTTCCEHPVNNDDETARRNIEVLNSEITPGAMGHVYSGDDFPSPASINAKNSEFWSTPAATPTVSVMGNPGPAPGNENSGRGQNFMPGAARSINNARRLSTTQKSLDMGKTGSWSTDRRVYNQIVKPSRATTDATKASIRTREAAAASSSATLADINKKNRAAWSKV
jgi:hypothetical protein